MKKMNLLRRRVSLVSRLPRNRFEFRKILLALKRAFCFVVFVCRYHYDTRARSGAVVSVAVAVVVVVVVVHGRRAAGRGGAAGRRIASHAPGRRLRLLHHHTLYHTPNANLIRSLSTATTAGSTSLCRGGVDGGDSSSQRGRLRPSVRPSVGRRLLRDERDRTAELLLLG